MTYEELMLREWEAWEKKMRKQPHFFEKQSRNLSHRVNQVIPEKIHDAITAAVKSVIHTALFGVKFLPKGEIQTHITLQERDRLANQLTDKYKKIASAEGAGTGIGGFKLSLVDFPALLSIKMKYLFELSHIYGFSTALTSERLFILYIFQLAFSGYEHRIEILDKVIRWSDTENDGLQPEQIDWRKLQQEYRDSIDFRKLLKIVPGIGAVVGAWANYGLLQDLGDAAVPCYHMRILKINCNE